jgi:small subunit ribosomal protein S5
MANGSDAQLRDGRLITRPRRVAKVVKGVCKSLGSANHINVARATIEGLKALKRPDEIARLRGKSPEEVTPGGLLRAYRATGRATFEPVEVA